MYPDGLMTIQGTTADPAASGQRAWRAGLVAAVVTGALMMVGLPRFAGSPGADGSAAAEQAAGYRGAAAIIQLCKEGRADDAVGVANLYLSRPHNSRYLQGELYSLRAGALRVLGHTPAARDDYARAEQLLSGVEEPSELMDVAAQCGDNTAAVAIAHRMLKENVDEPSSVNNACWQLTIYGGGDPDLALATMRPMAADCHNGAWLDTYAWSLYLTGHREEAIQQEQRALEEATPDELNHTAYYHACLVGMAGDRHEAARELRRLFQDNITFTSAWAAAQRFEPTP